MPRFDEDFKKQIVRLHLEEGRTIRGLSSEYGISKGIISIWTKQYREECQKKPELKREHDYMQEKRELLKKLEELEKENLFLKKATAFFAKEID